MLFYFTVALFVKIKNVNIGASHKSKSLKNYSISINSYIYHYKN